MLKLAGIILDFTDDPKFVNDREKMALISGRLVPFDKHAELPDSAFALLIQGNTGLFRRYPVYTKIATQLSSVYFDENHGNLHPEVAAATSTGLKEACQHYGVAIPESVSTLAKTGAVRVLDARKIDDGGPSYSSRKEAAQSLLHSYEARMSEMTLPERSERATALQDICTKLGMDLPQNVTDYSVKKSSGSLLRTAINQRHNATVDEGMKFASMELNSLMTEQDPVKVVEKLSIWDEKYRINKRGYYRGGSVIDPYRSVYGGHAKAAVMAMGTPEQDLLCYSLASVAQQYDDELGRVLTDKGMTEFRSSPKKFYDETSPVMRKYIDTLVETLNTRKGEAVKKTDPFIERQNEYLRSRELGERKKNDPDHEFPSYADEIPKIKKLTE